jgi:hypothetical protein
MITAESKAKLFEKTYDAYLLAQSVTRVYGVESPPGQSAMKKLRAEMKACSRGFIISLFLPTQWPTYTRLAAVITVCIHSLPVRSLAVIRNRPARITGKGYQFSHGSKFRF